jgi:amidase
MTDHIENDHLGPARDPALSPEGQKRRQFMAQAGAAAATVAAGSLMRAPVAKAQGTTPEICTWDADVLSGRIKARDVSCREVMEAFLGQIDRVNPELNAIIQRQLPDDLLAQADERDAQLARGEYMGWMHGMPQAIKDTALAKGIIAAQGSPILKDFVAPVDQIIVERAKAAGAIVIGKTNVPEFALGSNTFNPVYGATGNPYNPVKTVGGSSGGTAAALVSRMLPVADGSDFAGSIRNPSAFCGIYGLRPTPGVVPFWPSAEHFIQQFATEGPMGRTVKDVAMLLSIQAGHDDRAPLSVNLDPMQFTQSLASDVKGKKIAWIGNWNNYFAMDPGVLEICEAQTRVFTDLGCEVEAVVPDFAPELLWDMWLNHRSFIVGNYLGEYYADPAKRALMKAPAQWEVERSLGQSGKELFESAIDRTSWNQVMNEFFSRYDFCLMPTAQVFPFDHAIPYPEIVGGRQMETYHQWMGVVLPWSLAGTPVMNLPVGLNADGLPMGMQLIGQRQHEWPVIQMAYAYEEATQHVQKNLPPIM